MWFPFDNDFFIMIKEIFTLQKQRKIKRIVKTWTDEQNKQLLDLATQYQADWKKVSQKMQNRNSNQCAHRFRRLMRLQGKKNRWTPEQDAIVLSLVQALGKDWGAISKQLSSKTNKQIRQRYINKLDPKLQPRQWEDRQDRFIIDRYNQIGSRWNQIASQLEGRSQNMVKNRFYSHIKRYYNCQKVKCSSKDSDVLGTKVRRFFQQSDQQQWDPKLLLRAETVEYVDYNILDVESLECRYSCDQMFQI